MNGFLINLIITLAMRFGMYFLLKRFPGIPKEIQEILLQLIDGIKANKETTKQQVKEAKEKINSELKKKKKQPPL